MRKLIKERKDIEKQMTEKGEPYVYMKLDGVMFLGNSFLVREVIYNDLFDL